MRARRIHLAFQTQQTVAAFFKAALHESGLLTKLDTWDGKTELDDVDTESFNNTVAYGVPGQPGYDEWSGEERRAARQGFRSKYRVFMERAEDEPLRMLLGSTVWRTCGLYFLVLEKRCPHPRRFEVWRRKLNITLKRFRRYIIDSVNDERLLYHQKVELMSDDLATELDLDYRLVTQLH